MRVDLSDFKSNNKSSDDTKLYTIQGSEDFIDDDNNPRLNTESELTYAKCLKSQYTKSFHHQNAIPYKYFVKCDPNKNLYNPITGFSSINSRSNFLNKVCKSELVFTEVSEAIFSKYINFLRTSSLQWLTSAQRDIK